MTPPGETLIYLNLQPLRAAGWLQKAAPPSAPSYAAFVAASGFDFTRDLKALACSLQGAPLHPDQTTCVLAGSFSPRFTTWLGAHAQRRLTLAHGEVAYQFPGWAQPERPMYVYLPDRSHLVATNADPPTLARTASRTPALWEGTFGSAPPLGYLAVNTVALAAARQLDGTTPPWRGADTIEARLTASTAGLILTGVERAASPADAAAARAWAQQQLAALAQVLPPGAAGQLSVRDLLNRLQVRQTGAQVTIGLSLPPALLSALHTR